MKIRILLILSFILMAFSDIEKSRQAIASFYANKFEGRKTANGEKFSQNKLTCASNLYPLGTLLKITNVENDSSVIVKVNDRTSKRHTGRIDLSKKAFKQIGEIGKGILKIKIEII